MTMQIATGNAWTGIKEINGDLIAEADSNAEQGLTIAIYRTTTGRITIRAYHWHTEQDASQEGYLLDIRVQAADWETAVERAVEAGFPRDAIAQLRGEVELTCD